MIFRDHAGNLWVGTTTGLYRSNNDEQHIFKKIEADTAGKTGIISPHVRAIYEDPKHELWIGTDHGITKIHQEQNGGLTFETYKSNSGGRFRLSSDYVDAITEFPRGVLWVGYYNAGLDKIDLSNDSVFNFSTTSSPITRLSHNNVRKILINDDGKLWIGTRNGLDILDPLTNKIKVLRHDVNNFESLSDNSIHSLFKDKAGLIWLGTFYGGANYYSPRTFTFTKYKPQPQQNSISHNVVSSIIEDPDSHNLYIGTEGGGLDYLDRQKGAFTVFRKGNRIYDLQHNNIKCLYFDVNNNLWMGTSGGGLNIFNPKTSRFNDISDVKYINDQITEWIYSIKGDIKGNVWIGTYGAGLYCYDHRSHALKHFNAGSGKTDLSSDQIRTLLVDSKQNIWIGTLAGLNKLNAAQDSTYHYLSVDSDTSSLGSNTIYTLYEDSKHRIWAGTLGGGLNLYVPEEECFIKYTVRDGLPSNNVFGILEDEGGHFWVSTSNGLSLFDPGSKQFTNFNNADGLPGNEFYYNSACKTTDGQIFFGSKQGLISFNPAQIKFNDFKPPVYVTELKLFNKPVQVGDYTRLLKQDISRTKSLTFNYKQNIFTLDFSVLNYTRSIKNQYAYKLEGLEDQWNYVNIPSATYTNLQAGQYTFLVKGSNNDGVWNETPTSLIINVLPPPWKTWWAYVMYVLILLMALVLLTYFLRIRAKLEHELQLEHLENERQNELHQTKLQFFTNISHEIRTPLTLILGPLENLLRQRKDEPRLYHKLLGIKHNADRLLRLVNQIIDFRKQETGKLNLHAAEGNIIKFIREIKLSFNDQAESRGIDFELQTDLSELKVWYDRDELEKVFYNLISNAFNHTPNDGRISVSISAGPTINDGPKNEYVRIDVEDSGEGIPADKLDKIFDRFYQVDKQGLTEYGSGIGLALSRGIVSMHSGEIKVTSRQSEPGQKSGTCFSVYLPLGNGHFSEDQIIHDFKDSEAIEHYLRFTDTAEKLEFDEHEYHLQQGTTFHLLIVEDNSEIRHFLKEMLGSEYLVLEAPDGEAAWEMAIKEIPDLIISDIIMPGIDGIELCRQLKTDERTSHIPVILLTARTALVHKVTGLETGADEYVTKPFNITVLKLQIRNLIKSREKMRRRFTKEMMLQPANIEISSPDEKFLRRSVEILEANLEDHEFNVEKMALEIGMSRPVLYRKLKALTGLKAVDFIREFRLKKAAMFLEQQKLSVSEVAYKVGFNDPKYFSKSFKKQFGMSPTDFIDDSVNPELIDDMGEER